MGSSVAPFLSFHCYCHTFRRPFLMLFLLIKDKWTANDGNSGKMPKRKASVLHTEEEEDEWVLEKCVCTVAVIKENYAGPAGLRFSARHNSGNSSCKAQGENTRKQGLTAKDGCWYYTIMELLRERADGLLDMCSSGTSSCVLSALMASSSYLLLDW